MTDPNYNPLLPSPGELPQSDNRAGLEALGIVAAFWAWSKWSEYKRYLTQAPPAQANYPGYLRWQQREKARIAALPRRSPRALAAALIAIPVFALLVWVFAAANDGGIDTVAAWGVLVSITVALWAARKVDRRNNRRSGTQSAITSAPMAAARAG